MKHIEKARHLRAAAPHRPFSRRGLQRAAACTLCAAMACSFTLGAGAEATPGVTKEETVYATLASDGTVQSATDSVWLHADGGLNGYTDTTRLSDVTVSGDAEAPVQDGENLTFNTANADAWYQGTASTDLPITAGVTYTLDGQEMTAEELAGKSGHLVIHITFANHSYSMATIDGESRKVYTPFIAVVAATLPTDTFTNVKAENGMIQTDSANNIVGFACMPGMAETYSGLLTGKLDSFSDYLHDDVTLEADVTDFDMPMLYLAASTDAGAFDKLDELSGYSDLFDQIDELRDAMDQLIDGSKKLLDGSNDLASGTSSLYSGAQSLDSAVGSLQSGLGQLAANNDALNGGAYQTFQVLCDTAETQLNAGLTQAGLSTVDLTPENYSAALDGVLQQIGGAAYTTAKQQVTTQVNDTVQQQVTAAVQAQADTIYTQYLMQNADAIYQQAALLTAAQMAGVDTTDQTALAAFAASAQGQAAAGQVLAAMDDAAKAAAINGAKAALTDPEKQQILAAAAAQTMQSADTQAKISAAIDAAMASDAVQQQISAALSGNTQYQSVVSLKAQLDQYNSFYTGLLSYTSGVASAYSGAGQIKTGADTLVQGAAQLKDGTVTMQNGMQSLYDGIVKLNTEGISQLTDSEDIDNLQTLLDVTDAVKAQGEDYTSFAGAADGMKATVKFVMKVNCEETDTAADTGTAAETTQTTETKTGLAGLWERFTALFR